MTYIDYACLDYSINEVELEQNISLAIKHGIRNISVPVYSLSTLKNISDIKEKNISISCPVDFPYGFADLKSRSFSIGQLSNNTLGIKYIDLVIPTKIITNRKYDKFRDDIKTNIKICNDANIELRYILEYRVYSHEVLAKVCQILTDLGVKTVFPSSGTMIDDINDNLIACNFLMTKSQIKTITTGNIYNEKQINSVSKMQDLFGIRFTNINSFLLYSDYQLKSDKI